METNNKPDRFAVTVYQGLAIIVAWLLPSQKTDEYLKSYIKRHPESIISVYSLGSAPIKYALIDPDTKELKISEGMPVEVSDAGNGKSIML
jgi:hypothetical protein